MVQPFISSLTVSLAAAGASLAPGSLRPSSWLLAAQSHCHLRDCRPAVRSQAGEGPWAPSCLLPKGSPVGGGCRWTNIDACPSDSQKRRQGFAALGPPWVTCWVRRLEGPAGTDGQPGLRCIRRASSGHGRTTGERSGGRGPLHLDSVFPLYTGVCFLY